jgi:hypothetical protein
MSTASLLSSTTRTFTPAVASALLSSGVPVELSFVLTLVNVYKPVSSDAPMNRSFTLFILMVIGSPTLSH